MNRPFFKEDIRMTTNENQLTSLTIRGMGVKTTAKGYSGLEPEDQGRVRDDRDMQKLEPSHVVNGSACTMVQPDCAAIWQFL